MSADRHGDEHEEWLNSEPRGTGESSPPEPSVGWHPVEGKDYLAYWNGTEWSEYSPRAGRRPNTAEPVRSSVFSSTFLAILSAAIVIAIVAAIGFAIYRGNRDEAELERKSRELLCQWDGGTGPNCDALR